MAMAIRAIPVLEGAAARRFLREAKANEKKRGTQKFTDEQVAGFREFMENSKKAGSPIFNL